MNRLQQRKAELEDIIQDFEVKAQEEEEKMAKVTEEKKKLQTSIQDLEERYAKSTFYFFKKRFYYIFPTVNFSHKQT